MSDALKVGARGSPLALAQTEEVVARLRAAHPGLEIEKVVIKTHGDEGYRKDLGTSLDGKRAFTKRIDEALLEGRIDFAVHSLKDLPTELLHGLVIAAIPPRADPRDIFVANGGVRLEALPPGARVGTSSLRRRAQLLARWPSLRIVELHGNVGTRLRRLDAKEFDAVVIAAAGFHRLNIAGRTPEPLPPEIVTPAPGQGALAVEACTEDVDLRRMLAAVDDPPSRIATTAERAVGARIGGGCNVPLGALATLEGPRMTLRVAVASTDGQRVIRAVAQGSAKEWEKVVEEASGMLLEGGARAILAEAG